MKKIIPPFVFACIAVAAFAQTPILVKDVNTASIDADPILLTDVNGTIFFFAQKPDYGAVHTLWKSDGTANGTVSVTTNSAFDYYYDPTSSTPPTTGVLGNNFYWLYSKSLNISDGTDAGTVTLKTFTNNVMSILNTGTNLFILTYNSQPNPVAEVWVSDGTVAGTTLLKTFSNPPPNFSLSYNYFYNPVIVNNNLNFYINTATSGGTCCQTNTWKSDGTVAGTVAIGDMNWTNPFTFQNKLYYFDATGLIQSDENFATPTLVSAVPYGFAFHFQTVQAGSYLYFTHSSNTVANTGDELWRTDGTNGGTIKLYTTPDASEIKNLTVANGKAYFVSRYKVYQSTGTVVGTTVMNDFSTVTGGLASYPTNLTGSGTTLYFTAYTQTDNIELWKSDGTIVGTSLVNSTFSPGKDGLNPGFLAPMGANGIVFAGTGNTTGRELFSSNGTTVSNVVDIATKAGSSYPSNIISSNNTVYFTATTPGSGTEMWQTDGSSSGTTMVLDVNPAGSSSPSAIVKSTADSVFWQAFDGAHIGLYNNSNRHVLQTFSSLTDPNTFHFQSGSVGNVLYFTGYDNANGAELWAYDQGTGVAQRISSIAPGNQYAYCSNFAGYNNEVYFYALTSSNSSTTGLYKTDGSIANTVLVKSFSSVDKLIVFNGFLYFFGNDGISGAELWRTDGTPAGTTLVKDINPSGGSEVSGDPIVYKNKLYFSAYDGVKTVLWSSDGTDAGTTKFSTDFGLQFTIVNNKLFFKNSTNIMVTDGTAAGTISVANIGSQNPNMVPFNNYLVYDYAGKIKMTDGTVDGTSIVASVGSQPSGMISHQNTLYYADFDATHGRELWMLNMISPPTITSVTADPTNKLKFKIVGTNLSTAQAVFIAGVAPTSYTVVSTTEIDIEINNSNVSDVLRVNTTGGTATTSFVFVAVPSISSFTPSSGAAGTDVTITGDGFIGATAVSFGGVAAQSFTVTNNSTIHATIGSTGASGSIVVTTPGGVAHRSKFQFYPVPTITSFTPDHGPSQTTVTVVGTGFFNLSQLLVGTTSTPFVAVDSTKFTTKPTNSGAIKITAAGGSVTSTNSFTVDVPPTPPVTAIESESPEEVAIYPNPTERILHITYGSKFSKTDELSFTDVAGHGISGLDVVRDESGCTVNVAPLGSGLYFLIFGGPSKTSYAKFVKR